MPKSRVVTVVVLLALAGVAFFSNPSAATHRARIKAQVADRSPVAGLLGVGALAAFASTYHPLGVASYTTANDRVLSIGAFGMVFVLLPWEDKP